MPPVSEKQRRLVHARAAQGEKWAKEWASKDPGGKLPEESHSVEKAARGYSEPGRGGPEAEMREGDWEPPVSPDRKFTKPVGVYPNGKGKKGEDKHKVRMLKRSEAILELAKALVEVGEALDKAEKKKEVLKQAKKHKVYKEKRAEGMEEGAALYHAVKAMKKEEKRDWNKINEVARNAHARMMKDPKIRRMSEVGATYDCGGKCGAKFNGSPDKLHSGWTQKGNKLHCPNCK
jgi:hypothetical protein